MSASDPKPSSTTDSQLHAEPEIFCPQCGYDLRALTSDRCPECGLAIDREAMRTSRIPWTHRRELGRIRAYLQTVWLGTFRIKRLAIEAARPVDSSDALRFRLITSLLAGVAPAGLIVWEFVRVGGTGFIDEWVNPLGSNWFVSILSGPPANFDMVLPWLAGATLVPVLPVCAVLFMFLVSGAHTFCFQSRSIAAHRERRGVTLSYYAVSSLAWLPLLLGAFAITVVVSGYWADRQLTAGSTSQPLRVLVLAALVGLVMVPLLTWLNLLRLLLRLTHTDWLRTLMAAITIPLAWIVCAVAAFVLVPWMIGFLWIIVDSLI